MTSLSGRDSQQTQNSSQVTSHALHSDLEDVTPAGSVSGNSTPLSDYSPHSQPFAERPQHRTAAGAAAKQSLSALPSPPPFTPGVSGAGSVAQPAMSAAGSNNNMRRPQAWTPGAAGDTPGVTSAWHQPASSPASGSSAAFAFTPVGTGEAASPDAQPFGHAEQQAAAAQQAPPAAGPAAGGAAAASGHKAADIVRAASHKLSASHESDAMSDASGSVVSTSSTTRSFGSGLPAGSPGDVLRAATSKLSAQQALSGSARLQNPQRRKSAGLKTPAVTKHLPPPAPHSTPLMDAAEMRHSDDLVGQLDATAESSSATSSAPGVARAAAGNSPAGSSGGGSLKVRVAALATPAASPGKALTKSPGSRGSVVSIGSVCGAAAFSPLLPGSAGGSAADLLASAGKYTPTMKLDFGGVDGTPGAAMSPVVSVMGASISPLRSYDLGGSGGASTATPARSQAGAGTPGADLPDSVTGLEVRLQYSANKALLREAMTADDASRLQDQLQAALQEAGEDAAAALSPTAACGTAAGASAAGSSGTSTGRAGRGSSWLSGGSIARALLFLLAAASIAFCGMVAVQFLPPTSLAPGMVCTAENASACRAVLAAQLRAAQKEPSALQLTLLRTKWYLQDAAHIFWTRRLPEGVTLEKVSRAWISQISPKQIERMSHEQALEVFGSVPEHLRTPEIATKLAAATAHQEAAAAAEAEAARKAAAEAKRLAAEKAEAERRAAAEKKAAEEARAAAEKAEAERRAAEEARVAAEKAEAERVAKAKAEAGRVAHEKAERIAREKAEAERIAAEKAEAKRVARKRAEAERAAKARAEAERKAAAEEAKRAEAERVAAAKAEAERLAAERAAEKARLAAEAAEAQRLEAERAAAAKQEAAKQQAERQAAGGASRSWMPYLAGLLVLLLSVAGGGGGYVWYQHSAAAGAARALRQQQLTDIRSNYDEAEGQAYQDLGDMDPDSQQQQAGAAGAGAAMTAAAGALASVASKILTPVGKAPAPPGVGGSRSRRSSSRAVAVHDDFAAAADEEEEQEGGRLEDEEEQEEEAAPRARRGRPSSGMAAGSSRAAAAAAAGDSGSTPAATPRANRRGSRGGAAADSGVDSDAGAASTGRARSGARGRKAAAATPGLALEPLLEDAPAEPADDEGAAAAAEGAPTARRGAASRRQSAPAAASRRRNSAAAAAVADRDAEPADAADAATTPAAGRRSTRAARTPRV